MGKKEYDMIDSYLDGTLGADSARELERMAVADPDLAAELQAEQLIRGTLARDAATMPVGATTPNPLLTQSLVATSGTSGGTAGMGGGILGTIFGTGTGITVVTLVGLIGLTVGAIFFAESVDETETISPSVIEQMVAPPEQETGSEAGGGTERSRSGSVDDTEESDEEDQQRRTPRVTSSSVTREGSPVEDRPDRKSHQDQSPPAVTDNGENESETEQPIEVVDRSRTPEAMIERLQKKAAEQSSVIPEVDGEASTMTIEVEE